MQGDDINTAGAKTLCRLMVSVEDTNIIKRSDIETLKAVQKKAQMIIESNAEDITEQMDELNREFISLNISPGGCADLLAICFLLYFICE